MSPPSLPELLETLGARLDEIDERLAEAPALRDERKQLVPIVRRLEKSLKVLKEHGSLRAYRRGCRCDECRAANTVFFHQNAAKRHTRLDEAPHGTVGGYKNWGCRCVACTAVHSEQCRQYALRRKERAS